MTDTATMNGDNGNAQKRKLIDRFRDFRNSSPFARSFIEGMFAGAIILVLLIIWIALRADTTAENVQSHIPAKFAEIQTGAVEKVAEETAPKVEHSEALPVKAVEGLTETKDGMTLPVSRIEDDMTPFQAYKRPFTHVVGKHLVSIVMVDFGLSSTLSQAAIDNLPADISFVMTPYADDTTKWAEAARASGHEFWISLPMQTTNTSEDTGPNTLMINASFEQNQARLTSVLGSAVGYVGLVSQRDHAFTKVDLDISPVMKQIFGRGLGFAESNTKGAGFGSALAMEQGYPYVQNNIWLDTDLRPESIDRALQALELQAMKQGKAVAFVQPYPIAIKRIQEWMKGADGRGLQIAPLSAMVR